MSWLRSALNKAAEAGVKSGLGRNLQKYAGTVYQTAGNAVVGGTRILQNSLAGKHYNNFKHAVRRLEDVALNARGEDRQQALGRWLSALKDLQKLAAEKGIPLQSVGSGKGLVGGEEGQEPSTPREESEEGSTPRETQGVHRANLVLFYDEDISKEPMTFRDVFLRSLALENIVTSFIEDAPEDEEVAIVLEMFGLCLAGGPELHNAIMSGIQDLSKAAANYTEEVQLKRAGLLQMIRDCVSGLKLSAEAERLDIEVIRLRSQLEKLGAATSKEGAVAVTAATEEPALRENAAKSGEVLRLSARLHECLERKATISKGAYQQQDHQKKVDEMKEKAQVLQTAMSDMKKKIEENKQQKIDATSYRMTKAIEVAEAEKVLGQEVMQLEQRREKLEAELKEVKSAIATATHRHIYIQEEKEQFDEASSHIVAQLARDGAQLTHAVEVHRVEAGVAATWQSFLEDTWVLRTGCQESQGKETEMALKEAREQMLTSAAVHLAYRQEELNLLLSKLKSCAKELASTDSQRKHMEEMGMENNAADIEGNKRKKEEKYLDAEIQITRLLAAVERIKEDVQKHTAEDKSSEGTLKQLESQFAAFANLKDEFSKLERPKMETLSPKVQKPAPTSPGKVIPSKSANATSAAPADASKGTKEPDNQPSPTSVQKETSESTAKATTSEDKKAASGNEDEEFWKEAGIDPSEAVEGEGDAEGEGWDFDELEEELGRK